MKDAWWSGVQGAVVAVVTGLLMGWLAKTRLRKRSAKWFVIELHSGVKVRISAMLLGLPEFAKAVLAHVPRNAIDDASHGVLHETAEGKPPNIWD